MMGFIKPSCSSWLLLVTPFLLCGRSDSSGDFDSGLINVDFSLPEAGVGGYGPGEGAIGNPGDFWNELAANESPTFDPAPPRALFTTEGAPTSVTWFFTSDFGVVGSSYSGSFAKLVDLNAEIVTATINNLTPNTDYHLYLMGGLGEDVFAVNGVQFTLPRIPSSSPVDTLLRGVHYDTHIVASDPFGTLTFVQGPRVGLATGLTSWQLTPVPEPATFTLLGLGSLALVRVRRRR